MGKYENVTIDMVYEEIKKINERIGIIGASSYSRGEGQRERAREAGRTGSRGKERKCNAIFQN
ncbi:MAG: hypothetical protein QXT05_02985 [Candidatus Bilamarchaeaceae archaeon]